MKFKIWDRQTNKYFADGEEFNTLEDIREQLISYHETDIEEYSDKETLRQMSLKEILEMFEWEIHERKENGVKVQ